MDNLDTKMFPRLCGGMVYTTVSKTVSYGLRVRVPPKALLDRVTLAPLQPGFNGDGDDPNNYPSLIKYITYKIGVICGIGEEAIMRHFQC